MGQKDHLRKIFYGYGHHPPSPRYLSALPSTTNRGVACPKAGLIAQIHRRLRDYYESFFGHQCAAEVLARDALDPAKVGDPFLQRRFRNAHLVRKMHTLGFFYCECQGYMKYPNGEVVALGQYTTSFGGGFATVPGTNEISTHQEVGERAWEFLRQHDCGNGAGAGGLKTNTAEQSSSSPLNGLPPATAAAQQWSSEQMYSFLEVPTRGPRSDKINHRSSEENSERGRTDSNGSASGSAPRIQTTAALADRTTTPKTPPPKNESATQLPDGVSPFMVQLFEQMLAEFTLPEYISVNRLDKHTQERLAKQPPWIIAALVEEGPLLTAFNPSA